jgi:hypothetical protein
MLVITKCLVQACDELNIPYQYLDENQNFISVKFDRPYYFVNFTTPFGRQDIVKICRDKDFTYQVIKDIIRTPRTKGYLDPFCRPEYQKYATIPSYEQIVDDILKEFHFPVIIKRNQGTRGRHVYLCQHQVDVEQAISRIFDKNSKNYDYVAIAQDYIPFQNEFRVVVFFDEILLVYQKDNHQAQFVGNLSPLHWKNAQAVLIEDADLIEKIRSFLKPLYSVLNLEFAGLDVLYDEHGKFWLLEINSQPDFEIFVRDNGMERVVEIFKKLLLRLKEKLPAKS